MKFGQYGPTSAVKLCTDILTMLNVVKVIVVRLRVAAPEKKHTIVVFRMLLLEQIRIVELEVRLVVVEVGQRRVGVLALPAVRS
jgi:hypothetical protein